MKNLNNENFEILANHLPIQPQPKNEAAQRQSAAALDKLKLN
jgi:hypothetical protein